MENDALNFPRPSVNDGKKGPLPPPLSTKYFHLGPRELYNI